MGRARKKAPNLPYSLLAFLYGILTPILEKVSDENVGRRLRQVAGALVVAPTAAL